MSKKTEKKIKRLRKTSLLPQIIETFVVEVAFIILVVLVAYTEGTSYIQNVVTKNIDTCNQIVDSVSKGWDSSQGQISQASEEYLKNVLLYSHEDFESICIVDDDRNILASYGKSVPEDSFYKYFSDKNFRESGVYFREDFLGSLSVEDYDEDMTMKEAFKYGYDQAQEMEKQAQQMDSQAEGLNVSVYKPSENDGETDDISTVNMYRKLFFGTSEDSSLTKRDFYNWATKNALLQSLWVMYKTDIDGVNVLINKLYYQKEIESARQSFLLWVMGFVFLFIAFYEHYRLIVVIVNRRKIQKLIYTDPVTGGHNKDYFINKSKKLIKHRRQRYAIVYLRMEKYRNYIIAYGLKEGENLMEDFYRQLGSMIKKRKELVAHLEKSDFVLLLNYSNEELLNIRMQTITNALNESRPNQYLYFSVGASRIVSKSDDVQVKISDAGAAISKKANKGDEVYWFDEAMREEQVWERRVEDDMDKALANHEFKVYLQPKYSTKKEELSAAEALVRWIHPEFGFVSPGKFIPIFEKNGFIIQLDDFMLTEVAKLQAHWMEQGKKLVPISVNVSRAHFSRDDLAEHICEIVDEYKVPHEFIELELTESAFFDDKQVLLGTVKKLKDFGFKVSMDDFGAGYSSLNSLKELPLDIIKLDAQFFREIDDKKRADLIVGDTIKLAKKLGMQIVAEGIETREQVDFLAGQHCDLIQGFYFAKPLPIEEFEERAYPAADSGKKDSKGNKA